MKQNKKNGPPNLKKLKNWIELSALYNAEHRPSQAQKWADLDASNAEISQAALKRAQLIRDQNIEAGQAYLMGVADYHAALKRQRLLRSVDQKYRDCQPGN